jgi:acyl carrier protein
MSISSRTPEGTPNHCPVCNSDIRIEPSPPSGDAPCPKCGTLLWFIDSPSGMRFYKSDSVAPIQESLQGIISETLGLNKEQITSSSSFLADLQADSLDTVELVMALEEEFDLSISEDDLRQMKTVGDVIDYIIRNSP